MLTISRRTIRAAALAGSVAAFVIPVPSHAQQPRVVRIAAASDLRFAIDELSKSFARRRPDIAVRATYGSSGGFFAQIVNGAPFDVFMSADTDYPRQLATRAVTVPGSEFTYAVGHLVLWVPKRSAVDVEKSGLGALVDSRVGHVAIANPATAPYGRAAEAALRQGGVYDAVKPKLVVGESVAQALQFAQSGNADAALVALSLAVAPTVKDSGRYWQVPESLYPRLNQGGVILRAAADVEAAQAFRSFLLSDEAHAVLDRYGFAPAGR